MDNLKEKLARAAQAVRAFFATKAGKVVAAFLVLICVALYAHHRGVVSTLDRLSMQEPAVCPDAPTPAPEPVQDEGSKRRADELADQLRQSEQAKEKLKRKVEDYEKRLAKSHRKAGSLVLSPADARSLSNIK